MIKDIIQQNDNTTPNSKQLAILKENFPACFKADGSFDIERFKAEISSTSNVVQEGYELKFLGKSYAKLLASTETTTVIQPNENHNSLPENAKSENIYISGDNLDGLKHLLKSYNGEIKCIYIDPPYNTGSDGFVYFDNFNYNKETLQEKLSVSEEEAERILNLTKRGSASHSAWLMFMYSRLLLARDLLTDDGVIFISIDDNEQANLKLLCDDVFREENFISQLVWEKKKKGSYLADDITSIKEYVLVYANRKEEFNGLIGEINSATETYPCVNADNPRDVRKIPPGIKSTYKEKDYFLEKGTVISDTTMNLVLHSDLEIKNGILTKELIIEGNWRYSQASMQNYADKNEIYITRDLYIRRIVSEPRNKGLKDLLLRLGDDENISPEIDINNLGSSGWGSNEDADIEQRLLFGKQSLMSYPKPVRLILKLLASVRDKNSIVIDFFSGSATTAEATMALNMIDGGKRKFIMVQLPEDLNQNYSQATGDDKLRIKNVIDFLSSLNRPAFLDQLGIERIKRAAAKIKQEHPDIELDLGFKHYTLAEPNQNTLDKLDSFDKAGLLADTSILDDFGKPTILATWLNADGYGLTHTAEVVDLAGYIAYYCQKHLYLIDPGFTLESMKALLNKYDAEGHFNPENLVLFGYSFPDWSINEMIEKNLRILNDGEKNLKINFTVRY